MILPESHGWVALLLCLCLCLPVLFHNSLPAPVCSISQWLDQCLSSCLLAPAPHSSRIAILQLIFISLTEKERKSLGLFSVTVLTQKNILSLIHRGIPQWLPPSRCQSFLPWQCGHLLYWSWLGFGTSSALKGKHKFDSCHKHALSYTLEKTFLWSFVSADVAVMENTFQVRRGKERRCCARVTLCLFPLSPRGAKARRATFTKRGRGCAWCWNRWEESSVPPRYAIPPSSLSLSLFHSCIPPWLHPVLPFRLFWLSRHIFFPLRAHRPSFSFVSPFSPVPPSVCASSHLSCSFFLDA